MAKYRFKLTGWITLDVPDDVTARVQGHDLERAIREAVGDRMQIDQVALMRHGDREGHNLLARKR